ncbi:MAG: glycosyltransferase family 2 protein [Rubrivivax sp.]|nr:MAG: glycosyltransferase family 2 protein [Rubrivivax sp.]
MPRVSVVIPAYNAQRFVAETIASVKAQSYQDIEIIVVDDGSTDQTASIAESFEGVRCIRKPNGGVSSARNRGVAEARGELLAFVDSDDVWHPDKLRHQVALMDLHPEIVLGITASSSERAEVDAFGRLPEGQLPRYHVIDQFEEVFLNPYLGMSGVMVRKDAFNAVNGFDQTLPFAEDVDFYLRLLFQRSAVVRLNECVVYVRVVEGSLSYDGAIGYAKLMEVYRRFMSRHGQWAQDQAPLIRRAFGQLHLRKANCHAANGEHLKALGAAVQALRLTPSKGALFALVNACVPASLKRLRKQLRA